MQRKLVSRRLLQQRHMRALPFAIGIVVRRGWCGVRLLRAGRGMYHWTMHLRRVVMRGMLQWLDVRIVVR
jgi:hypothetical protein